MALIIEDGTNIANANSYATLATIRTYALTRGITLSAVDADLEVQVIKAMDYLEAQRSRYQGSQKYKTSTVDQSLQWPRKDVLIDCIVFPSDEIPQELIDAESQLVIEIHNGVNLYPTETEKFIKEEKLDVMTTKYSETIGTSILPNIPSVSKLLDVLFNACGNGNYITNIRV